jgi:tetratricopeptide (TPR) repeat protein
LHPAGNPPNFSAVFITEKTRVMKTSLAAALMGLSLVSQWSASMAAEDQPRQFLEAQSLFERGLRGSEKDNEQAAEKFRALAGQEPDNPLYLAYYGSTFTLKARDAYLPWKKLRLGEEGLDLIDKSLKRLDPEHDRQTLRSIPVSLETRLVAVTTFLKVPDQFFHRYDRGRTLLAQTMNGEVFAASPAAIRARFYFQAALVAQTERKRLEEIEFLKHVAELDPDSPDAPAAAKRLKELGH